MLMHSRKQFQIRAVTAGAIRMMMLMPDGHIWWRDVVILGANRVARGGKHEQLGWPPQTVFAEYGPVFAQKTGSLAYEKPLSSRGHLVSVNLITSSADHKLAVRLQQREIGAEINFFRHWLKTRGHPRCADWPAQMRQLEQSIKAFANHTLTYYQLLQAFISRFDQGSQHQAERTKTLTD
ncbi:hypothetical protein [Lacticaseibacillus porcinae]|uniref:hypothetical protein n=1 Tax=Lacticaseibacillus porcinae TaxID=1123687 RepID=UPI000F79CB09|nr:hypothetical protein [Lacticaseibacillus porcinae]